jgi:hypothetical protein
MSYIERARAAARRFDAAAYEMRARFIGELTAHITQQSIRPSSTLAALIISSFESDWKPLVLDELTMCQRFGVVLPQSSTVEEIIRWASGTYTELGNQRRLQQIESLLRR